MGQSNFATKATVDGVSKWKNRKQQRKYNNIQSIELAPMVQ